MGQNEKTGSLEFDDLKSGKLMALSRRKRKEANEEDLHKKILINCCIRGVEREIDRHMRATFHLCLSVQQGVLSCATARPPVAASAGALSLAGSTL